MFFGKSKNQDSKSQDGAQPKRRSTLGLLFNPDIGASLRPLGEATSVFVRLIAMIFAMNGLFPKNHPALLDEASAPRLTLTEIIHTAWGDLQFTKAGMPKVALFVAVVGTMILAALSIVTALLAGFVGTAHAQGTTAGTLSSAFSPASNDLAQNWLDYLFKAVPLSNYYAQNGAAIPSGIGIQCAMMSALGFYSKAMLVFAGFILFYHLIAMVAHTAHDGVVMGKKANQVWAPIRLVVAIGLLVPVGGGASNCATGGGLNSGQYIVIKMASLGSGMASQAWNVFLQALSQNQVIIIQPSTPAVVGVARDITMMEACRFDWNYNFCLEDAPLQGLDPTTACQNPNSYTPQLLTSGSMIAAPTPITNTDGSTTYRYTSGNLLAGGGGDLCGKFTIPAVLPTPNNAVSPVGATVAGTVDVNALASTLSQAHVTAINNALSSFVPVGAQIIQFEWDTNNASSLTTNSAFVQAVTQYQTALGQALQGVVAQANGGLSSGDASAMGTLGWAAAGAWLNTISRDQGAVVTAYQDGLPQTASPDVIGLEKSGDAGNRVAVNLVEFGNWLSKGYGSAGAALPEQTDPCILQSIAAGGGAVSTVGGSQPIPPTQKVAAPSPLGNGITKAMEDPIKGILVLFGLGEEDAAKASPEHALDLLTKVIDIQATQSGVWGMPQSSSSCKSVLNSFNLGAQLVTANPLAELSFWGYANLDTAYSLWKTVMWFSIASTNAEIEYEVNKFSFGKAGVRQEKLQRQGLNLKLVQFVTAFISWISSIFFMCGFNLAFIMPLLPFFRFFFSVLTWVASLLEAVVAMPLVALAHLNPEGDGLSGQSAKAAYFLVFNLFLRPILSVFGLIAGLLLFYVAIMFLNQVYAIAVTGTTVSYHFGKETIVRIIYTVTYAVTAYVCANNCFKTIGAFPEYAMRWIGASAHHEKMGDGGNAVRGAMGQVSGQMGEKAMGVMKLKPPG